MGLRPGISARHAFLCVALLMSISSATLEGQDPPRSSAAIDASVFSDWTPPVSLCDQSASGCSPRSIAVRDYKLNPQSSGGASQDDWVHAWLRSVDETRASQPHFVSPIVTTHVMLVQQYRYDMSWQQDPTGGTVTSNYGASRGVEIIPTTRLEVGIFPPPYLVHQSNVTDGFGDFSCQVKLRAFSATEGKGDYFVGFFLGGSLPTGTAPNGLEHAVLSPTFGAAKGLGPWDFQSTIGANLPVSGTNVLGRTIIFNTAVDYRIKGKIWPMLEQNSTFWSGGTMDGMKEVFLTPGLVLGTVQIGERLHLGVGGGVQIAATRFHQFNHRWILSVRFPF
ncbi:MAG: hypothetical protein JWO13_1734 [Acidobacteriales bacterium]|nr:hypothetical protein [Terriglobales bacterium]